MPDADDVLALEPEELGLILLRIIHKQYPATHFHLGNIAGEFDGNHGLEDYYPDTKRRSIKQACWEAFAWLSNVGFVVPSANNQDPNWKVVSRKGVRAAAEMDSDRIRTEIAFPKALLHSAIRDKVWPMFLRGEYGAAVFAAMRHVEIGVREAGGYGDRVLGVDLMRHAFRPKQGPLTDTSAPIAEQEARMSLFSGAIGSYKNPHSHREVDLNHPQEAAEVLMLASHLLRIVEGSRPRP